MLTFIILSFIRWDGSPAFHIVVGTICTLFFILHIFLHRKWLAAQTKKFVAGKISAKVLRLYIVDVLLLVIWTISIVTGVLATAPYVIEVEGLAWMGRVHGITARLALVLVVVHLLQHIKQVRSYFGWPRKNKG